MVGMRKLYIAAILLAGALIVWGVRAQQSPSSGTSTAAKSSGAKSATSTSPAKSATETTLTTDKQKEGYALGMNIGKGLQNQSIEVDIPSMERGLRDSMSGAKPLLSDDEIKAELAQLNKETQQVQADKGMKESQAFLAENKTKPGVTALPDGLQYKVITQGTGPKPKATDTVVCNYRGTFINGQVFDDSYKRGQPATFPVDHIIKGWTEALQLMPVGSKWQLFIPPDLAYGASGRGPIPPNTTLIFEVELISIKPTIESVPNTAPKQ